MTQDKIEKVAVRSVEEFVENDERLKSQINSCDKEPLWDGYILLYKTKVQKNENLIGRIPIQVKGKENGLSGDSVSYPVDIVALRQYAKEGIGYFVVNVTTKEVYYTLLDPLGVNEYLKNTKAKKTCSIRLKRAEPRGKIFYSELLTFYYNCKRQISFIDTPIKSATDVVNKGGKVQFFIPFKPTFETCRLLPEYDIRAYWDKGDCLLPLKNDFHLKGGIMNDVEVSVGGIVFYSSIIRIIEQNSYVFHFNDSTTFTIFDDDKKHPQFNYKQTATTLSQLIADLEFLVAVIEHKGFTIGTIEINGLTIDNKSAQNQISQLDFFKKVKSVFAQLHITEELNVTNLTDADYRNLNWLIKAFIDKEPLSLPQKPNTNAYLEISNLKIYLLFLETENGQYVIEDFFSREKLAILKINEDSFVPVPSVYFLSAQDYYKFANVDYGGIMPMVQHLNSMAPNYAYLNKILLDLLLAYDLDNNNKSALNVAMSLAEWLKDNCTGVSCKPNHIINYLQALERAGMKGDKENDILLDIIEHYHERNDLLTAANLLLEQPKVAMKYFEKLSLQEQNEFRNSPIGHYLPKS